MATKKRLKLIDNDILFSEINIGKLVLAAAIEKSLSEPKNTENE